MMSRILMLRKENIFILGKIEIKSLQNQKN